MDIVFKHLVHWLAPVLCFTAEEAWISYNENHDSIHLSQFPSASDVWCNREVAAEIERLRSLRKVMTGALESARSSGKIGSSLGACVRIYDPHNLWPEKSSISPEEVAIVSSVIRDNGAIPQDAFKSEDGRFAVVVEVASGKKCDRCWKVLEEVNEDLCIRCKHVVNINACD
jgi:isoleucyl-tRNA synthetase